MLTREEVANTITVKAGPQVKGFDGNWVQIHKAEGEAYLYGGEIRYTVKVVHEDPYEAKSAVLHVLCMMMDIPGEEG